VLCRLRAALALALRAGRGDAFLLLTPCSYGVPDLAVTLARCHPSWGEAVDSALWRGGWGSLAGCRRWVPHSEPGMRRAPAADPAPGAKPRAAALPTAPGTLLKARSGELRCVFPRAEIRRGLGGWWRLSSGVPLHGCLGPEARMSCCHFSGREEG